MVSNLEFATSSDLILRYTYTLGAESSGRIDELGLVVTSDPILRFAFWSGVGAGVLILLLLIQIVLMRFMLIYRERRKRRFLAVWRPLMVQSLSGNTQRYPPVLKADVAVLLNLWNHFQESLRGEASERLNQMACDVSMDVMALNLLRHRRMSEQLLAMMTLGHLRTKSAWRILSDLLKDDNPIISLAAARALMKIDALAAIDVFMPLLVVREDWPSARIASILKEAGAYVISEPLANLIRHAPPEQLPRLIQFLELTYSKVSSSLVREVIEMTNNPQVIAACLRVMSDSRDLHLVRKQVRHPDWPVRVQAAAALGRIGSDEDRQYLVELLEDPQWWVRYRAAQALSQLPFVTTEQMQQLLADQTDRYARDMLKQVIAERLA